MFTACSCVFFNRNQEHPDLLKTRHFRDLDHVNLEGQDGTFWAGFRVKYLNIDCTCGLHLIELQASSVDISVRFSCPLCLQAMERRGDESSHPGAVFQTWSYESSPPRAHSSPRSVGWVSTPQMSEIWRATSCPGYQNPSTTLWTFYFSLSLHHF